MAEHLLEMAKALVRITDGRIEVLTDPLIKRCPLRMDLYSCQEESRETVEQVLKGHIADLGMYGPDRKLHLIKKDVSFGASEILADALDQGLLDAAVVVCEGAGTVVVTSPQVVQAVGAHMTGLIRTDPIAEIAEGLIKSGCQLLDRAGTIDQVAGYKKAVIAGFNKVAVTVTGLLAQDALKIREIDRQPGHDAILLAVHNTGIDRSQAEILAGCCDLVWSCASQEVRDVVGPRSLLQIGISIPVFAASDAGKRLLLNRAMHFKEALVISRATLPLAPPQKQPHPLI